MKLKHFRSVRPIMGTMGLVSTNLHTHTLGLPTPSTRGFSPGGVPEGAGWEGKGPEGMSGNRASSWVPFPSHAMSPSPSQSRRRCRLHKPGTFLTEKRLSPRTAMLTSMTPETEVPPSPYTEGTASLDTPSPSVPPGTATARGRQGGKSCHQAWRGCLRDPT